jgi:gliding motility-associated-like protein
MFFASSTHFATFAPLIMRPHFVQAQIVLVILLSFMCSNLHAQCSTTISTFPYNEDFETTSGNWTAGGTSGSWAWGTPAKPTISTAGSGSKCWVTGGLTGSGYNSCERSYVESPCFNFTSLTKPVVSFKILWECENKFDGVTFQYTINGGTTWQNVGAFGDPSDCHTDNWFNYDNITHLGNSGSCSGALATTKHGWCGSVFPTSGACQGGNGTGNWITAKHCVANLAGQPNVQFRFAFGAGNSCNAYDGAAFDSVSIYNARALSSGVKTVCTGNKTFSFTDTLANSCITSYLWNFGDPASGSNTSGASNAVHTFSSNGTYTVTMTGIGGCANAVTNTIIINTMDINTTTTNPLCLGASNGTAMANILNVPSATSTYTLMPGAVTNNTGNFSGLNASVYTITATNASGCVAAKTFSLNTPSALSINIAAGTTAAICSNGNGIINVQAFGGAGGYTYVLSPDDTNTTGQFSGLIATTFTATVIDANGCSKSLIYGITGGNGLKIKTLAITDISCPGKHDGTVKATSEGGVPPILFNLQLANVTNTNGNFTNLAANTYTLTVLDNDNCSLSTVVTITTPEIFKFNASPIQDINCYGDKTGTIKIAPTGGTGTITATLLPQGIVKTNNYSYQNLAEGTYTIVISDINGCTMDAVIPIKMLGKRTELIVGTRNTSCALNSTTGIAIANFNGGALPVTYQWSTQTAIDISTLNFLADDTYTVTATDILGCSASATFLIGKDNCCKDLRMSSAFTPNDDGVNDGFRIIGNVPLLLTKFEVFNRLGQAVFTTTNSSEIWDGYHQGMPCESGTYFYYVSYVCVEDGKPYTYKGDVQLIK